MRASNNFSVMLRTLVRGIFLLAFVSCRPPLSPDHIILVTIDTLRADHLGSYGYPRNVSPFLDQLAAEGVRFNKAVSSSSHTAPSHASLFTSQYPATHGVIANGTQLNAEIPTIASMFQSAGFQTAAVIGARFLSQVTPGFEEVHHKRPKPSGYWPADRVVDKAIVWLTGRDKEKPFFLWVHLYDVHSSRGEQGGPPYEYLSKLKKEFQQDPIPIQAAWKQHGLSDDVIGSPRQLHHYDAQLAYVDTELERLYRFVETHESDSEVLWAITADHGEGLGNHGFLGHGRYLYQEQLRVPLILHAPKSWEAGLIVPELVRHVDLMPTLAELTGIAVDQKKLAIEGRSLLPLLDPSNPGVAPAYAYSQRRPPTEGRLQAGWSPGLMISAQSDDYKYILRTDGDDEFYDLSKDPIELENMIETDLAEKQRMAEWLARKYEEMSTNSLGDRETGVQEEFVEELRALGYL